MDARIRAKRLARRRASRLPTFVAGSEYDRCKGEDNSSVMAQKDDPSTITPTGKGRRWTIQRRLHEHDGHEKANALLE